MLICLEMLQVKKPSLRSGPRQLKEGTVTFALMFIATTAAWQQLRASSGCQVVGKHCQALRLLFCMWIFLGLGFWRMWQQSVVWPWCCNCRVVDSQGIATATEQLNKTSPAHIEFWGCQSMPRPATLIQGLLLQALRLWKPVPWKNFCWTAQGCWGLATSLHPQAFRFGSKSFFELLWLLPKENSKMFQRYPMVAGDSPSKSVQVTSY